MDASRYIDLYLAETREHLRTLNRALLDLEDADDRGPALEAAFRAAHTIKGASAMLGFEAVAERAHELESALELLRTGDASVDAERVDELLAICDGLEASVRDAVERGVDPSGDSIGAIAAEVARVAADAAGKPARREQPGSGGRRGAFGADDLPDGTERIVRVELRADARLQAARALVVLRRAADAGPVLGSVPPEQELGDAFDGTLWLFVGAGADRDAVESAIRSAGEVERIAFEDAGAVERSDPTDVAAGDAADGAPGRADDRRVRHVRVSQGHLDELADGIGELAIVWRRMKDALSEDDAGRAREELSTQLDRRVDDLEFASIVMRMVPVAEVFDRFPRVVRDAARELGKRVDFRVEGREIELDRTLLEEVADPLVHLLRNAVAHGLESPEERAVAGKPERGRLTLRASRERAGVLIEVIDDGAGIRRDRILARAIDDGLVDPDDPPELTDEAALRLLGRPGFSTADRVSGVAGRGVGLDVVMQRVRALGGAVGLHSTDGGGASFTLRLPLTFAVTDALHVTVAAEQYLIPLTHVDEAVELDDVPIARVRGDEVLRLRDELVPLVRLREALGAEGEDESRAAVVAEVAGRRVALGVDEIVDRERIVVKEFDAPAGLAPYFSGATLLADGRPALVLDPTSVL